MSGVAPGVPFTVLTGFLGAGKTTVLNRMLSAPLGRRIAVLVNELGRIPIDGRLILAQGGDVLELAGGCVCCKIDVKNDLWDGIADVVRRSRPDAVVLETTGIAEPPAILAGLRDDRGGLAERVSPAGIVCVLDAEAGARAISAREEARTQLECADRVLLSKLDLASREQAEACHRVIDEVNPGAERASFPPGEPPSRALTAWVLERRRLVGTAPHAPAGGGGRPHVHRQGQLAAVSFSDPAPLLAAPLRQAVEELRDRLHRVKGFVHLAGEDRRGFLELAGARLRLDLAAPWGDEPRRSEIVLIGEDLDELSLRRSLWACRVGG